MPQLGHGSADAPGTAASHPAVSCQHNRHHTKKGLWIPAAARMTMERGGTAVRRVSVRAAEITADNEKTLYPYYSGLSRLVHLL